MDARTKTLPRPSQDPEDLLACWVSLVYFLWTDPAVKYVLFYSRLGRYLHSILLLTCSFGFHRLPSASVEVFKLKWIGLSTNSYCTFGGAFSFYSQVASLDGGIIHHPSSTSPLCKRRKDEREMREGMMSSSKKHSPLLFYKSHALHSFFQKAN